MWGSLAGRQVSRSKAEPTVGPEFFISISQVLSSSRVFDVRIHGYIKQLFLLEAEVSITVGLDGFSFNVTRRLFDAWDTQLLVTGNTNGDFYVSSFIGAENGMVRALIDAGLRALSTVGSQMR